MMDFIGIRIVMIGEDTLAPYIEYRDKDGDVSICEYGSTDAEKLFSGTPSGHYGIDMLVRVSAALELERAQRMSP